MRALIAYLLGPSMRPAGSTMEQMVPHINYHPPLTIAEINAVARAKRYWHIQLVRQRMAQQRSYKQQAVVMDNKIEEATA